MESESIPSVDELDPSDAEHVLDELRRAELLSHTRYPRLGRWYPPAVGTVAALWVLTFALPRWVQVVAMLLLAAGIGAATRLYNERRGVTPNLIRTPRRMQYEMIAFVLAIWATIGLLGWMWHVTDWWQTALAAFVVVTALIALYEHRYARAARSVERSAGIDR